MSDCVSVSILVPCFNSETFITQCIQSILDQTLDNIEIICINDGSTDRTLEILQNFKKKDERIVILNKKNTGYGDSMNRGLELARGEYIGIVEADDFVPKHKFSILYEIAHQFGLDICKAGYLEYHREKAYPVVFDQLPNNKLLDQREKITLLNITPSIWSSIYRRSFLVENNIGFLTTPGASYQDTSFVMKAIMCSNKILLIPCGLHYYRTDNKFSSINQRDKVFFICREWKEIYNFMTSHNSLANKFMNGALQAKFSGYFWNFNRINWKFKIPFLLCWWREFVIHFMRNEINITRLSQYQMIRTLLLIFFPFIFLFIGILKSINFLRRK